MDKVRLVEGLMVRQGLPLFHVGDTLRVLIKIPEGDKIRIHPFEGTVIERRGQGLSATFTLRKVTYGEGVERTFPVNSPMIERIEVKKKGRIKRARLYYLRKKVGKATKIAQDTVEETPVGTAA